MLRCDVLDPGKDFTKEEYGLLTYSLLDNVSASFNIFQTP